MRASAILFLTLLVSGAARSAIPLPKYAIIEIPSIDNARDMFATGIDRHGDVVGNGTNGYDSTAFLYQHSSGVVISLTGAGYLYSAAYGMSDSGLIAGAAQLDTPVATPPQAFLWSKIGGAEQLPIGFYSTVATDVNNRGVIVGFGGGPGAPGGVALVWTGPEHSVSYLPSLLCQYCPRLYVVASAVNNRGYIVGESRFANYESSAGGDHAVEWRLDKATGSWKVMDLGGLNGASYSYADGINDRSDVVGASTVGSDEFGAEHAFLYQRGMMTDLGTLQGDSESSATSINNGGEVVGWSGRDSDPDEHSRGFLYVNGRMYNLNDLIDPTTAPEGVAINNAVGITDAGWIAANGVREGRNHAYLLIPGPRRR